MARRRSPERLPVPGPADQHRGCLPHLPPRQKQHTHPPRDRYAHDPRPRLPQDWPPQAQRQTRNIGGDLETACRRGVCSLDADVTWRSASQPRTPCRARTPASSLSPRCNARDAGHVPARGGLAEALQGNTATPGHGPPERSGAPSPDRPAEDVRKVPWVAMAGRMPGAAATAAPLGCPTWQSSSRLIAGGRAATRGIPGFGTGR